MNFEGVSNERLIATLQRFVGCERRLVAKVVLYLAEVEDRRLHLEHACPSMHDFCTFCTRKLRFSEGATHRRLTAARLVRTYPQLLEPLREGRLLLSNLVLLRDHFKHHDADQLIASASDRTRKEIEELIARLAPKPDVPSSIARVHEPALIVDATAAPPPLTPPTPPSRQVKPLAAERFQVTFTASIVLRDKLERARDLLRHVNPTGDLDVIVDRALDLLIEKLEKEHFGKTAHPRESRGPEDPADISAATRREVSARDDYQCTFRSVEGERCPERGFLELDHQLPRALGGAGDAANVRTLCRAHNQLAAEKAFGREHVEYKIQLRREPARRETARTTTATAKGTIAKAPANVRHEAHETRSAASREESNEVTPVVGERPPRDVARAALLGLGFKSKDVDRVLAEMAATVLSGLTPNALREAIGRLTA